MMKPPIAVSLAMLLTVTSAYSQWTKVGSAFSGPIGAIAVSGAKVFAASNGNGILLSTDDRASWSVTNVGSNPTYANALFISDTNIFAATAEGVYRSSDDGKTWTLINRKFNRRVFSLAVIDSFLFAGTGGVYDISGSVYRSRINDTTWTQVNVGLPNFIVRAFAIREKDLFAGTHKGVFRSTNLGGTWTWAGSGMADSASFAFASVGTTLVAGTYWGGVYESTDLGLSWTAKNAGLTNLGVRSLCASEGNLFAGTDFGGVFLKSASSESWQLVGLETMQIAGIVRSGVQLIAATNDGIWIRPLSQMTTLIDGRRFDVPGTFELAQNYPNPFNPSTSIQYSLSERSHVVLSVFNTLGQQVARLVDEEMAAGKHEMTYSATGMASGIYLYRLNAGSFVQTRTMIMLK